MRRGAGNLSRSQIEANPSSHITLRFQKIGLSTSLEVSSEMKSRPPSTCLTARVRQDCGVSETRMWMVSWQQIIASCSSRVVSYRCTASNKDNVATSDRMLDPEVARTMRSGPRGVWPARWLPPSSTWTRRTSARQPPPSRPRSPSCARACRRRAT